MIKNIFSYTLVLCFTRFIRCYSIGGCCLNIECLRWFFEILICVFCELVGRGNSKNYQIKRKHFLKQHTLLSRVPNT